MTILSHVRRVSTHLISPQSYQQAKRTVLVLWLVYGTMLILSGTLPTPFTKWLWRDYRESIVLANIVLAVIFFKTWSTSDEIRRYLVRPLHILIWLVTLGIVALDVYLMVGWWWYGCYDPTIRCYQGY